MMERLPGKGNLEEELRQILASAHIRLRGYESIIEDLSREELEHDLREYREAVDKEVAPLLRKALIMRNEELFSLAQMVKRTYERIIEMIEEKLGDERNGQ